MDRFSTRSIRIGPKVHRNKNIGDKWGLEYHKAIQDVVFSQHCFPFMPTEPPASLSEEIVESGPLYVCRHCRDCFRFQSSFEEHNARHCWILGLWCRCCFDTICNHPVREGYTKCSECLQKNSKKRAYLQSRGNKHSRVGVIKVFYNQCQFIDHMKMHQLSIVNMGDLMLIPLPVDISDSDWSFEFEILCEALMEVAFLLRTHIIDWLKEHNLQDNWWKLVNGKSNDSKIKEIVDGYQGRQLFKPSYKTITDMFSNSSNVTYSIRTSPHIEFIDDDSIDKNTNNSVDLMSDKNIIEDEDNPCIVTDIAFVDCGPTSQYFEPEIPVNHKRIQQLKTYRPANATKMNNKIMDETCKDRNSHETNIHENVIKKTAENNLSKPSNPSNITKTGVSTIMNNSFKISIPFSAKKNSIIKTNLNQSTQSLQTSRANNKMLNVQAPKNIAIINQFSSQLVSNQKIVLIGQDSCNVISPSKNELTTKKDSSNSVVDNSGSNTSIQKRSDSNIKKQKTNEKIIINNGQKYVIKRIKKGGNPQSSSKSLLVKNATKVTKQLTFERNISKPNVLKPTNSNEVENGTQQTSLLNNISVSTPSPPPKLSNNESHVNKISILPKLQKMPPYLIPVSAMHPRYMSEIISLVKEDNGDLYMDVKLVDRIAKESFLSVCDVITKYRREMFAEFYQMNSLQLKERLEHLQYVTDEMKNVMNFISDNVFQEKLRSVNTIKCLLEECLHKSNQNVQDEKRNDDIILNEWEMEVSRKYRCLSCIKYRKPESYIVGFSKLAMNDNDYCSCYKEVCQECQSYQGSISRFVAHQNFHKKKKPFTCPECDSKFKSATSLEVHTWTVCFHTLKKVTFGCKICEIDGFRDLESITRHFVIMHGDTKIGCEVCNRVFASYNEYVQHRTKTHPVKTQQKPVRLVIYKLSNVILRCENYMPYLEKNPVIRKLVWFKCPFCQLITTDNKHVAMLLNTHLRNNHIEPMSKVLSNKAYALIFGAKAVVLKTQKSLLTNTIVPKIVNTRTISSEIFERGSQNMEHIWPTDIKKDVNESSQVVKNIDDKEKGQLLPKIVSVVSMNDLKPSKPEKAIMKIFTETKTKSNSPVFQLIVNSDGKMVPHEETVMESDSKSNNKEKTTKTTELDKDNELITNISHISEFEKKPLLMNIVDTPNSSIVSNEKVSSSISEATDNRIKIIDIKTICKSDIELLANTEICDTQTKDENASNTIFIPKPPPLARIPQHLLKPMEVIKSENESTNDSNSRSESLIQRTDNPKIKRIALGSQKKEVIDYLCHLCKERINTSQFVMEAHFREKHADEYRVAIITPQLSQMSHDFINGDYKQFINNRKRKSDNTLSIIKRKRRWTKKHTEIKDTNPPVGLCVKQETAEDGEGNFICKKCGQQCSDMSNLREHIAADHRLKGRYLICLECGENFVVAPSLQMHLKAFHGIEDPINYMNQNPSYAPSLDSDLQTEEKTTVANQCYVCMAVFEDKAAVDKHLRVHGMAFLNRKMIEARNALKKKVNMEESKQNIKASKETAKRNKPVETILEKINAKI
ncbi:uncharacterized protein [Mycetomoellerius zeteki]|uniref:uncharacterized protein isoform X1 n=1 Tax=Mycetomoellerius zeteki TaxID=64791 RepID=UPI00084E9A35|nr:PREDICTED: uncharacterized protein LOC108727448 isoform X1 [Trachymyrmex zeteki]XP_018311083.1 PREDICTED: uncharacterized protein LOC108727448 isoform X1 [Trachymyrmex zeteki]XP_018311084.1 PREDICTED: uncharacterized protein LOC108727448 isoform X2 [Trachymyrmex zeteki]